MNCNFKLSKVFVTLTIVLALIIGMFSVTGTKIEAKTTNKNENKIINPVYDDNGELIEFTVILKNTDPALMKQLYDEIDAKNINLMTAQMDKNGIVPLASGKGIYSFVDGVCSVVELLSGYSCIDIARHVGLKLVDGWYKYNGNKYTGTWQVTRGYIPGCEPRHSEGCFRTTYKKIA